MEELRTPGLPGERARILIAEDHPDSREALQALLEAHGYEVIVARDGREAVASAGTNQPEVILMDVMMPVMDGLAATRELRALRAFDGTPILALTAMEGGRERAMEAGCDDYIAKPIELKALYQKVGWWLANGREVR